MCEACYEDYLPFAEVTQDIKTTVGWLYALYEENGAGGALHVVVDDMNLPVWETWPGWMNQQVTTIEQKCMEALNGLTEHEQATAIAIHHGHFRPEGTQPRTVDYFGAPFETEWPPEVRFAHSMAKATGWHGPSAWLFTLYNTMREEEVPGCAPVDPNVESDFVSAHDHDRDGICKSCGTEEPCEALLLKAWTYRDQPGYKAVEWKPATVKERNA